MKRIILIALLSTSLISSAKPFENEPVLIKKIGSWTTSKFFYPEKAIAEKTEGTVYVSFKLSEQLVVTEIKIEEGVSVELDQKAIELVADLAIDGNNFTIGKKYILPIKFVIK